MEQILQPTGMGGTERLRVEAVVETLATLHGEANSLLEVAHETRNMVTALALYCDLLDEPGVLAPPFRHYAGELRLVAAASRRLVEKLVALDSRTPHPGQHLEPLLLTSDPVSRATGATAEPREGRHRELRHWDLLPSEPIANLAGELLVNRNLLSALAGPSIAVTVDTEGCAVPVRLTGEDLTRVLVNLVKNAAEATPGGGHIRLLLRALEAPTEAGDWVALTVEDSGPGIPAQALNWIFEPGYTTHTELAPPEGTVAAAHRGLGLAITRSIVEAAGGHIRAENRSASGARFLIEIPVRGR